MAEIVYLPLVPGPHRKFTGSMVQLEGSLDDNCQIFAPVLEWDDVVPHSQSEESNASRHEIFFDFFLLQSTFIPLTCCIRQPASQLYSIVGKIVQKPLYTPHKRKREVRVLLVTDYTVQFPLHLWLTSPDTVDTWDVLREGDAIAVHRVVWCREREAIYVTSATTIHNLANTKPDLLGKFVQSLH